MSVSDDDNDTFRILVATDIHLGYAEKDAIRGDDSFRTFEEVLQIAVREEVDFLLLGGDLFHETKPSPYCIFKCTELLRKYCLGDRPVQIEFLSDQAKNFQNSSRPIVNYEDPDLNISVPVFSIHGNHDDPTGNRQISAMDLMSSTGLLNYFGKWTELSHVVIEPILLRKGNSHLALYGLSHIKDERLGRLFLDKKVTMSPPPTDENEWFHLLVWHQNRVARASKNFIPEDSIPSFLDLVIWGHEHDSYVRPVGNTANEVHISQPGSTVATSLTEGEAITKEIGLLSIKGTEFNITPIELKTVRPFVYKTLTLDPLNVMGDSDRSHPTDRAMNQVKDEIDLMINEANGFERDLEMLPLIRLKVFYHDERQLFNSIRFGQSYVSQVANPEDIVTFTAVRKTEPRRRGPALADPRLDDIEEVAAAAERVEDIVLRTFESASRKMNVLSVKGLNEAVAKYITSGDTDAPLYLMECQIKKTLEKLREIKPDIDELAECLIQLRDQREQDNKDTEEAREILASSNRPTTTRQPSNDEVMTIDSDDDEGSVAVVRAAAPDRPARGRGSRGGRTSRGPRGRGSRARAT